MPGKRDTKQVDKPKCSKKRIPEHKRSNSPLVHVRKESKVGREFQAFLVNKRLNLAYLSKERPMEVYIETFFIRQDEMPIRITMYTYDSIGFITWDFVPTDVKMSKEELREALSTYPSPDESFERDTGFLGNMILNMSCGSRESHSVSKLPHSSEFAKAIIQQRFSCALCLL